MAPRKLNARALAADVHGGLGENGLMSKYELSPSQLQIAIGKLLQAGLVTGTDLPPNLGRGGVAVESRPSVPAPSQARPTVDTKSSIGTCPNCGRTRIQSENECSHCGIVFFTMEQTAGVEEPIHAPANQSAVQGQPRSQNDFIVSTFYEESSQVAEKKRKKRLWIVWTAVALAVIPFPFAILGYGRQITLIYAAACALFMFLYYLVVVYYAWQFSPLWGITCFFFSPAAILFVVLNWNTVFEGKLLPRLWLAVMVPFTAVLLLAKFGHL